MDENSFAASKPGSGIVVAVKKLKEEKLSRSHGVVGGSYFQPLSRSLRLKVALEAAKGLAFLHIAETKIIYRDIKTSNILFDSNPNFRKAKPCCCLMLVVSGRC